MGLEFCCNVGTAIINHHPFMVIRGAVYFCYTNILLFWNTFFRTGAPGDFSAYMQDHGRLLCSEDVFASANKKKVGHIENHNF